MKEPQGEGYRGLFEALMKQLSVAIRAEKKDYESSFLLRPCGWLFLLSFR